MYGPEGNSSFCFPESPYIKCFVICLEFPLNSHIAKTNKQRRRAGNNCNCIKVGILVGIHLNLIRARDQESTNHKSLYITKYIIL